MAEKKQDSFVVNDRRLFTTDGELRQDVSEEELDRRSVVSHGDHAWGIAVSHV